MKRTLCLLLTLVLLFAAALALADEPVKLTIAIPDKVNVEDYNTNEMTIKLEAELGCDIEFEVYPATDYKAKINLMIQSGDKLPDIIIGNDSFDNASIYEWSLAGALIPLTDYYADPELAVNIQKTYEEVGDFRSLITMPDGEIYNIPKFAQSVGNEQGAKLFIDMSVLEELGLPVPTTTEELADTLRKVVAAKPDMIGLAGYNGVFGGADGTSFWFDYLMNSFVYSDSSHDFMKVEDGVLSFSYTEEAWKEGLKYIKGLIDEGLIAKESLTQDRNQWITMINACQVFGICYIAPSDFTDERKSVFESIDPMIGPEGVQFARYNPTMPASGMLITVDCQNPEAAFRLGDLLCRQDYTITNRWGAQGQDWDYFDDYVKTLTDYDESKWSATIPGCEKLIIVYDDPTFWGSGNMQNRAWMGIGPQIRGFGVAGGRTINADTVTTYTLHMAESYMQYPPFYPEEYVANLMYQEEESEEISEILANLETYVSLTTANWLLGNGDMDAEWDAYLKELSNIGIERAQEIAQAAYTRSHSNQ